MKKKTKSAAKTGKPAPKSDSQTAGNAAGAKTAGAAAAKTGGEPVDAKTSGEPVNSEPSGNSASPETAAPEKPADPLAGYDAAALRDLYLRAVAEKENTAKRAEAEIQKARAFVLDRFSRGICEVRDCLEAALAGGGKPDEGVQLTLKKLADVMDANGILPVRPDIGAPFDPELHMAVGVDAGGKHAANTVAAVVQCGYTLNGRVVRAAGVMVGKPANND